MTIKQLSYRIARRLLPDSPELESDSDFDAAAPRLAPLLNLKSGDVLVLITRLDTPIRYDHDGIRLRDSSQAYPSLGAMVKSAAGAAVRAADRVVRSKRVRVSSEVFQQRLAACKACPYWEAEGGANGRCRICGCSTSLKLASAAERCPDPDGPRWSAV